MSQWINVVVIFIIFISPHRRLEEFRARKALLQSLFTTTRCSRPSISNDWKFCIAQDAPTYTIIFAGCSSKRGRRLLVEGRWCWRIYEQVGGRVQRSSQVHHWRELRLPLDLILEVHQGVKFLLVLGYFVEPSLLPDHRQRRRYTTTRRMQIMPPTACSSIFIAHSGSSGRRLPSSFLSRHHHPIIYRLVVKVIHSLLMIVLLVIQAL